MSLIVGHNFLHKCQNELVIYFCVYKKLETYYSRMPTYIVVQRTFLELYDFVFCNRKIKTYFMEIKYLHTVLILHDVFTSIIFVKVHGNMKKLIC